MLKRIFIPPLFPVVLLLLLSIWVITGETQIIDGRPDNAPMRAAGILLFVAPLFYIPFGILNLIDSGFDRFTSRIKWAGSVGVCIFLSVLLTNVFYRPDVDSSAFPGVGIAIVTGFMSLLPMSLIRRLALTPREEASTLISGPSVPFDTLFPNAEAATIMKKPNKTVNPTADRL